METSTFIEDKRNCESCGVVHTVTVRSTIFQNYWVKFQNGKIEIGHQGETSPFISFMDKPYGKEDNECRKFVGKEVACESVNCHSEIPKSPIWKKIYDGDIPDDALFTESIPNCDLLVGRANHEGDLLPGKVCLSSNLCYVIWRGVEYEKTEYEVLTGDSYKWVPYLTKASFMDAVPGGRTEDGTTLYIGRTTFNNTLTPGKVYPLTGLLYISQLGLERTFTQYDILVFKSKCNKI